MVEAACLFDTLDDSAVHALIERLFLLDTIRTVNVNRDLRAIEISYDGTALRPAAALARFSAALGAVRESHEESALGHCLRGMPGRVRCVERLACPAAWRENVIVVAEKLYVEYEPALAGPAPNSARQLGSQLAHRNTPVGGRHWPLVGASSLGEMLGRAANLTAAGGCFVISIIGFVIPGIPTVPFVLATSYFLVRSSPALHDRFRRSRLFGPMVRDFEDRGGLQLSTKLKLVALTFAIVGVTIAFVEISVPLMFVMATMTAISLYVVLRLPTVTESSPTRQLVAATA